MLAAWKLSAGFQLVQTCFRLDLSPPMHNSVSGVFARQQLEVTQFYAFLGDH